MCLGGKSIALGHVQPQSATLDHGRRPVLPPRSETRPPLRRTLRAGRDRPGDREEPLLPGAALQRHGLPRPDRPRLDAGGQDGGGWAVVCTEEVEVHHTSDIAPYIELQLWDDRDIPAIARVSDRVHEFGALAGIELYTHTPTRRAAL